MSGSSGKSSVFDRLERAFGAFARSVVRFRWLTLALVLGATAALGYVAATKLRVDASTEGLLGSDSPSMLALDRLTSTFGPDKTLVLAITGDVYSPRFLDRLTRLHHELDGLELELATAGTQRSDRRRAIRAARPASRPVPDDPFAGMGGAGDPFADIGGATSEAEAEHDVFESVTSLVNAVDLETIDGALDTNELLATRPADPDALRRRVNANASLVGGLVDRRGELALIVLRPRFMDEKDLGRVVDATDAIVSRAEARGFHVERTGIVSLQVNLNRIMERDIGLVFSLALLAMIAMLVFLYRSFLGVATPVVVILLSIVATHGAMAIGLAPVTGVTSVLATMLLVIGMADAVHVVSAYRDRLVRGMGNDDAIVDAIAETAWPITFTAITDVAGLIGFRTSSLEAIRDMGTYGSIGILAALVYTLTLLPVLLTFQRASHANAKTETERDPGKRDAVDRLLDYCERMSRPNESGPRFRGRNRVLFGALVLSLVALFGASKTKTVHDPLTWLPYAHPERVAVRTLEQHGFGVADMTLVVRARGDHDLRSPELVRGLAALEADVRRMPGPDGRPLVTHVGSILDLMRDAHGALTNTTPALPTDAAGISDTMTVIESASPSDLGRVATVDLRTTRVALSVRWLEASAYGPFAERVRASAARHLHGLAEVETTGSVFAGFEVTTDLNGSLRGSFFTAVLSIALTMILLVFSVRIGLLAMIPNLVPILGMLGTMGLLGLPLDLNGLLVGSIAMGLVVDDTIHVVHSFVRHRASMGVEQAVRHVFLGTGRALVGTGLVLAGGFAFFVLAELENVRRFGGLLALSIVIALFGDLILTPAVLRCLGDSPPKEGES